MLVFEETLQVAGYEFRLRDLTLFTCVYECDTRLWSCQLTATDLQCFARAWRRTGPSGLLFLDQCCICCDDATADPQIYWRSEVAKFVQSLDRKALDAAKRTAADDPDLAKSFPALHEYLTLLAVGKEPREPSRLSVFTEDGVWKAFLNDPHTGRYACMSSKTYAGVLRALEDALAAAEVDWRVSKGYTPKRR